MLVYQASFSPVSQSEVSSLSMRSFLFYGDSPKTWQQVWCVITRTEPATLDLYAAPQVGPKSGDTCCQPIFLKVSCNGSSLARQDVKPLSCLPLLSCEVDGSCPELQGLQCFCLNQATTRHTFCCDGSDLKRSWLAALKDAASGKMTANTLGSLDNPTCEVNRDGGEQCVTRKS